MDDDVTSTRKEQLGGRLELARGATYRLFAKVRSEQFFYFEDVLNVFIALAQQPLNFAILKSESGTWKPVCHFCADKKHLADFEKDILSEEHLKEQHLFELFPVALGTRYRIVIVWMHTKFLKQEKKWTLIERGKDDNVDDLRISEISWLAKQFFSEGWPAFDSALNQIVQLTLNKSLETLEYGILKGNFEENNEFSNRRVSWPPNEKSLQEALSKNKLSNDKINAWHNEVNDVLVPAIRSTSFGSTAYTSMARQRIAAPTSTIGGPQTVMPDEVRPPKLLQNSMLFYRTFDRETELNNSIDEMRETGRHSDNTGSYPFNIRILLDDSIASAELPNRTIREFLTELKSIRETAAFSVSGSELIGNIRRYRGLLPLGERSIKIGSETAIRTIIAHAFDHLFWEELRREKGIEGLLEVLSSQIGDMSRSIADPVFYTGLIHLNSLFKDGGLDRVKIDSFSEDSKKKLVELHDLFVDSGALNSNYLDECARVLYEIQNLECAGVYNDILRIAIVFYLMSEMASPQVFDSSDLSLDIEESNLSAILLPIKIRGSVWAVSIHATYLPSQSPDSFSDDTDTLSQWLSRFNLMTAELDNITGVVDRSLWESNQRRITRLLADEIGSPSDMTLNQRLNSVNESLRGEQRLVPFVLPEFYSNTLPEHVADYYVSLLNTEQGASDFKKIRRVLQLCWKLKENPYFLAHQPWPREGSVRSFRPAVELGQILGFRNWSQITALAENEIRH